ncbi:MAG TPA: DUF4783 domain-containing protein [Bacteroidia bacterium]|jgi:hypothetical protein|nr:DUF4783 domain-containing protein [Sphingobacteriales bacterium]HPD66172.1 DUF4783 domain-containing protein [Bacteroidia bacterium]HRS59767.1 DUF4783 domain-containing protein [Bacteroidia bacterium]
MRVNKFRLIIPFLILSTISIIVLADIFDEIALAIKSGNSREIAKYFSARVELKINNTENIYSKAQAELLLRDFFNENPPVSFVIKHKSSSSKGLQYVIGYLQATTGKFRTYILCKDIDNVTYIQELQFEKEN